MNNCSILSGVSDVHNQTIIMFSNDYDSQVGLVKTLEDNYKLVKCSFDVSSCNSIEAYKTSVATFVFDNLSDDFNTSWLLTRISEQGLLDTVPIAFTTSEAYTGFGKLGYEAFACDILPVSSETELVLHRISNLVEMYLLKQQIGNLTQIHSKRLMMQANKLREQTQKMHKLNFDLIELLVAAIESRDVESGQHIKRIRYFVKALLDVVATECPQYNLTDEQVEIISLASAVHDIGKISIPDAILLKPARLTKEEFELMKAHTTKGARLLSMLDGIGDSVYFQYCHEICLCHHERWDGKGYPAGLKNEDIPISAQVVSVADCYDALTSERPYKHALSHEEAVNLIKTGACGAFSPDIMQCFDWCLSDFKRIEEEFKNAPPPSELQDAIFDNMEIATEEFTEVPDVHKLPKRMLERYEQIILDSYDMIFEYDFRNDEFIMNKGDWTGLFGYIPRNLIEALAQMTSHCHQDDLASFTQNFTIEEFRRLAKEGFLKTRAEFRLTFEGGKEIYVIGFVAFVLDKNNELVRLCGAFNGYKSSLFVIDVLPKFRTHDGLTGLMVEAGMKTEFEMYLRDVGEDVAGLMAYIDIDGMTYINNTSGYEFGNSVIKGVGDRIAEIAKGKDCLTCRLGSDKFCVFVKNIKRRVDAVMFIEDLHKNLKKEYKTAAGSHSVTVTIGVSRFPEDGADYRTLLSAAEFAAQLSKLNGSDMYAFFNPSVNNAKYREKAFMYDMNSADMGNLDMQERYIPVFDKKTGALIGYDYFPFSILGDVLPIPSDVFREALFSFKNKKHMSIIDIKEIVVRTDNILRETGYSPFFSTFTLFTEADIPAILQELGSLYEAYPEACRYVCLCLPQPFLDKLSWRNLKAFADSVRSFGFSLGVYLVGDKILNLLCLSEGVFDRIVLAGEIAEKAFTGLFSPEFLSQIINHLSSFGCTVTIPSVMTDHSAQMLFNYDCVGFSVYEPIIVGTEKMLAHFSEQNTNKEIQRRHEETTEIINPESLLFGLNKSDCLIIQFDYVVGSMTYSNNLPRVLGYGLHQFREGKELDFGGFVHADDVQNVLKAYAEAKQTRKYTFCTARVMLKTDTEDCCRPFNFSFLPTADSTGVTTMVQVILLPQE